MSEKEVKHTPVALLACPKCKGTKLKLDESILIVETREIDGAKMSDVLDAEPISTTGYDADCSKCGHRWRPRRSTVDSFRNDIARATS